MPVWKQIAMPLLSAALLAFAQTDDAKREITMDVLRGYLNRMYAQYVPHPRNENVFVATRVENQHADRIDLYVELRKDKSLVLTAYARTDDRYYNRSRATDREKLFERLLETNHRAFATFFVDEQGDIGARFTFTTEGGVGYEAFRAAALELMRITDQFAPTLDEHMKKN